MASKRSHAGLAAANINHLKRVVKRSSCASGGLYTSPTSGQSLSPSNPLNISWDNACLGSPAPSLVDIYLYAPALSTPLIHVWTSVPATPEAYTGALSPGWWNGTASSTVSLQLLIVDSGTPAWMTSTPSGPFFTVTTPSNYSAGESAAGSTVGSASNPDSIYQSVASLAAAAVSKGAIAAAVLVPILLLILAAVLYIRWSRKKEAETRKRFSQALDKRMSVISTDWKPTSAAGVRASIAVGSHRGSLATSTYYPRTSSTFATEGGQAGVGAYRQNEMSEKPRPSFQTTRTLGVPTTPTTRMSRVSFAPTVHPRFSMAARDVLGDGVEEEEEGAMSPTQLHGPTVLADEDVARGSMDESFKREVLQMPAMTMMRTGRLSVHIPPALDIAPLAPITPLNLNTNVLRTPSLEKASLKSPTLGILAPPSTATHMTPDEQLRAYAARRAASPMPPVPAAVGSFQGMRVLYDPTAHQQQQLAIPQAIVTPPQIASPPLQRSMTGDARRLTVASNNPFRTSAVSVSGLSAGSRYSQGEEGAYGHEGAYGAYGHDGAYGHEDIPRGTAA